MVNPKGLFKIKGMTKYLNSPLGHKLTKIKRFGL